jgi:bifunctional ADP-heptose synthase (sugar kinase/adenylyltransferase)
MIEYAASLGNELYVGLDSDTRVKARKGVARPIQNEQTRMGVLKSLRYVNDVIVYSTDLELERIIQSYSPNFMVLGADYKGKHIIGQQYARDILFFDKLEGYSTSLTIQKIRNERIKTNID